MYVLDCPTFLFKEFCLSVTKKDNLKGVLLTGFLGNDRETN